MFEKTLSPIRLGKKTLNNRIVFGAHTNNMAAQGEPNARQIEYLRARNQAGMVVVEPLPVHRSALFAQGNVDRTKMERSDAKLREVAQAVKENGAVGILQLIHLGQHGDGEVSFLPNWSPSGLPSFIGSAGSHEMTPDEIETIVDAFVRSARLAQDAGFDGIDLFANYQGLIEQFWTPWFNRRSDAWGGDLESRTRFSREILKRIKAACGQDFITGLSISYLDMPGVTLTLQDLSDIVMLHDIEGLIDYVSCGTGGYLDTSQLVPAAERGHSLGLPLAQSLKSLNLSALVQVESGFRDPGHVETALASDQADLVSLVRAQIAEPNYVAKLKANAPGRIRPCLGCNQKCIGRRARDKWISCVVNPSTGREWQMTSSTNVAERKKKVTIVGAGPAGLTLAALLSQKGNNVALFDRADHLGGLAATFGQSTAKARWLDYIAWLTSETRNNNCVIELGTSVQQSDLEDHDVDAIVWATGAHRNPSLLQRSALAVPPIDASETATDVATALEQLDRIGHKVLFVDDHHGFSGLPSAVHIAKTGRDVTFVTGKSMAGQDLAMLGTLGPLRKDLFAAGGTEAVDTVLLEWDGADAVLKNVITGQTTQSSFDHLVWSDIPVGGQASVEDLATRDRRVHVLGDACAPRDAAAAIQDAYELERALCH